MVKNESTSTSRVVAMTVPTLFAGHLEEPSGFDRQLIETALAWQERGESALFAESLAVLNQVEPGRVFTIYGRIASAGEQLGLAGTALRDARAWLTRPPSNETRLPARALAETASYFALSAARGVANISARLLALESRSRAVLAKRHDKSGGFPAFDAANEHWLAFNEYAVTSLEMAADHHLDARELVALLRELEHDEEWTKLVQRRHRDFHRWRPQSIDGTVATTNPWMDAIDYRVLTIGHGGGHSPSSPGTAVAEVAAGVAALERTMRKWNELFPAALEGVQTFVLADKLRGEQLRRDYAM